MEHVTAGALRRPPVTGLAGMFAGVLGLLAGFSALAQDRAFQPETVTARPSLARGATAEWIWTVAPKLDAEGLTFFATVTTPEGRVYPALRAAPGIGTSVVDPGGPTNVRVSDPAGQVLFEGPFPGSTQRLAGTPLAGKSVGRIDLDMMLFGKRARLSWDAASGGATPGREAARPTASAATPGTPAIDQDATAFYRAAPGTPPAGGTGSRRDPSQVGRFAPPTDPLPESYGAQTAGNGPARAEGGRWSSWNAQTGALDAGRAPTGPVQAEPLAPRASAPQPTDGPISLDPRGPAPASVAPPAGAPASEPQAAPWLAPAGRPAREAPRPDPYAPAPKSDTYDTPAPGAISAPRPAEPSYGTPSDRAPRAAVGAYGQPPYGTQPAQTANSRDRYDSAFGTKASRNACSQGVYRYACLGLPAFGDQEGSQVFSCDRDMESCCRRRRERVARLCGDEESIESFDCGCGSSGRGRY